MVFNFIFLGAIGYSDLASTQCDDILSRLDFLTNISPENYNGDDYEFSRFKKSSVGEGDAAYGAKSYDWIGNKNNFFSLFFV